MRASVLTSLGYDGRDAKALQQARNIAEQALQNPASVSHELAFSAIRLAALNGDQAFYDQLMTALKSAKAPEQYYMYLFSLARFSDPQLLERTLNFAVSPEVRSQDALQLIRGVMDNPAGEKLAWAFVQSRWDDVQKAGGPFASAEIVASTESFCSDSLRDEVKSFYDAHKIAAAERTYRQSIEHINDCIDLKSQQEPQLASWLGQHSSAAGGQ